MCPPAPNNPMLHNHLAASLMALDRHRDAQTEIELAIEGAPDLAEFYRTRARLRTTLRQTGGLADDLRHFELLSNVLPRRFWGRNLDESGKFADSSSSELSSFRSPFSFADRIGGRQTERITADPDSEELIDRTDLASAIRLAGEPELAAVELGKVLILDPNHIGGRYDPRRAGHRSRAARRCTRRHRHGDRRSTAARLPPRRASAPRTRPRSEAAIIDSHPGYCVSGVLRKSAGSSRPSPSPDVHSTSPFP